MIDEKALCEAVEEANQVLFNALPSEEECSHRFSKFFEEKMEKIIHKEKQRKNYRILKKIASVLLILFIGAGSVFILNSEARASFSNWMKKVYEEYVVYSFKGDDVDNLEENDYKIANLPKGYVEVKSIELSSGKMIMYENEQGDFINLSYDVPSNSSIAIVGTEYKIISTKVGKFSADFYLFEDPQEGNSIIWIDDERNVLFQIDGRFDENEIISLAESVVEQ